ncbi:hypothetical protein CLPUN_25160 [Clostridium puniceum]|uniref:Uncharacterized protein n=1 Tax=Clostridium puniceum TaxID=29367 RepID=A0A1S8TGQ6_9CLOT|nr:hypothetical protein [Clostridium puniceum]OOM76990.1 hypothetical protein CLPUN_25160 [Clostridium puniceum]
MKIYFDNEGLVESQEFDNNKELQYCLFSSISMVYPFIKYEEELAQINDYCFFILYELENKLKHIIKDSEGKFELVNGYKDERDYSVEEIDEIFDPVYMFSPVNVWEKLSQNINKCTMLLLVLSYLESSLNEITNWFCKERSISIGRKEKGDNEVLFYIKKISECCDLNLTEILKKELDYLNYVRKIRNQFVHKEWDQVEKKYTKFHLCDVFNAVSLIFSAIENAAFNACIIS